MVGSLGRKDLDDTCFLQKNIFMVDRHALDTLPVCTTSLDCAWSLEAMMSCFLASSLFFLISWTGNPCLLQFGLNFVLCNISISLCLSWKKARFLPESCGNWNLMWKHVPSGVLGRLQNSWKHYPLKISMCLLYSTMSSPGPLTFELISNLVDEFAGNFVRYQLSLSLNFWPWAYTWGPT